jgi:hypothetical protein
MCVCVCVCVCALVCALVCVLGGENAGWPGVWLCLLKRQERASGTLALQLLCLLCLWATIACHLDRLHAGFSTALPGLRTESARDVFSKETKRTGLPLPIDQQLARPAAPVAPRTSGHLGQAEETLRFCTVNH